MSARASFRRMRQPPEKASTACSSFARGKPQSVHQAGGAAARGIAAGVLERFVQRGEALAVILFVRLRQLLLQRAQGRIAIDDEFDRRLRARRNVLRHMRDSEPCGQFQIARFLVQFSQQQREQARFAAAVRPDHADLLSRMQSQVDAFEQQLAAARERELA